MSDEWVAGRAWRCALSLLRVAASHLGLVVTLHAHDPVCPGLPLFDTSWKLKFPKLPSMYRPNKTASGSDFGPWECWSHFSLILGFCLNFPGKSLLVTQGQVQGSPVLGSSRHGP